MNKIVSKHGLPVQTYLSSNEREFFVEMRTFGDFVHLQFRAHVPCSTRVRIATKLQEVGFSVTLYIDGRLVVRNVW